MTSILVDTSKAIAAEIETHRKAGDLSLDNFVTEWDYENRKSDAELGDTDTHVRVIVPRKFDQIERDTQTTLAYVASFDIDVRKKLGVAEQDATHEIAKEELECLSSLVEEIHSLFHATSWLELASGLNAEWIAPRDDVPKKSEILIAYSTKFLRDSRQFYGVCREVFQITS